MHNEKETIRVVYCEPGKISRITEIGSSLEDLQRAVRVVRSQAAKRGFSPDKIGATGISAGAKAVLLISSINAAKKNR